MQLQPRPEDEALTTGICTARLLRAGAPVVAFLPAALLAAAISRYAVDVPYQDQWDIAHFFVEHERGTLSVGDLFAQINEYRQFFPNLVFFGLGELTDWRVEYEVAVTFLVACLVFTNILFLARRTLPRSWLPTTFLAALLIFSPVQYDNWLWGIQLVYFAPIACLTTGILVAYSSLGTIPKFGVGAGLCVVSTFSSANGILAWLLLLPVFLLLLEAPPQVRRGFAAAWAVLLVASGALYFYDYETPAGHPSLAEALTHPFHAGAYVVGFLGSAFGVRAGPDEVAGVTAGFAGTLLLGAFLASSAYVWRLRADRVLLQRTIGWIALGAYSLTTAILVAIGRLGFGVGQSLSSRYTTFSLYLAVGLAFLAAVVIGHLRQRGISLRHPLAKSAAVGAAALVALQLPVYGLGFDDMQERHDLLKRGKACLHLVNVAPNEACLERLYPDVELLKRRANELDELGFLRPSLAGSATSTPESTSRPLFSRVELWGEFAIEPAGAVSHR